MRILLTGNSGLLHKYLFSQAPTKETLFTLTRKPNSTDPLIFSADLLNFDAVKLVLAKTQPDVIIHAAALSDLDYCETHRTTAMATNLDASINLFEVAKKYKSKFIFISSSNIYRGSPKKYYEDSIRNPVNYYGLTKKMFEDYLVKNSDNYAILRFSNLYGLPFVNSRKTLNTLLLGAIGTKKKLGVINNKKTNFLYAGDASGLVWKVAKRRSEALILNFGGPEVMSFYSFAVKVKKALNLTTLCLAKTRIENLTSSAPRASCLNLAFSKAQKMFNITPSLLATTLSLIKNES